MKNRQFAEIINKKSQSKFGRIIVLTGARQTGKTTLARKIFSDFEYISVEDPVLRNSFSNLSANQWKQLYPQAILDEVQKEPKLIESIKSAYDQWEEPRYVLLGSSQLLLLEKVPESLAGRCSIMEIFPLTLPELLTKSWKDEVKPSLFQKMITEKNEPEFLPSLFLDRNHAEKIKIYEQYLETGGYPAISDDAIEINEKYDWLKNYVRTYLERDIRDLASFRDLEPFIKLQQYLALNTANVLNASSIAKQLGISIKTVQRYIKYFEISYQAISLPSWSRNNNKRLVKSSKIHFLDPGIAHAVLNKQGGITGNEYESAIVSEIYKQTKNIQSDIQFSFLRTHDGKDVDLLLEFQNYYLAFEIKMTQKVIPTDAKHLKNLNEILDKPIKKSFIISNDTETKNIDENIIAIHAVTFLG
jgi:predicted AAA+ superfamily ATPase